METTSAPKSLNVRPIIGAGSRSMLRATLLLIKFVFTGVMTQATSPTLCKYGKTYIPATYVKFIESAGARVVPVFVNGSPEYYEYIFNSINGVLWPGGARLKLLESSYGQTGKILYDLAVKSNKSGDYFPIWGTCQGFELMVSLAAGKNVLSPVASVDENLNVTLFQDHSKIKLLANASKEVLDALQTKQVTYNHHKYSLTPMNYTKNLKLNSVFSVVSTSENSEGTQFISMIEAKDYPFYGVQFHPEKPLFTWDVNTVVKHDPLTILTSQYFANFFVSEARLNNHFFPNYEEEKDALIFNYNIEYLKGEEKLDQAYFFDDK